MPSRLIDGFAITAALAAPLRFEAVLEQARFGAIPRSAAAAVAKVDSFESASMADGFSDHAVLGSRAIAEGALQS